MFIGKDRAPGIWMKGPASEPPYSIAMTDAPEAFVDKTVAALVESELAEYAKKAERARLEAETAFRSDFSGWSCWPWNRARTVVPWGLLLAP